MLAGTMRAWLLVAVGFLSCVGPPAPDAELCRDVVTRLCLGPVCPVVTTKLAVTEGACEATLLSRTGCERDEFAFDEPSRARFVECRVPLARESTSRFVKASCEAATDALELCPDLVSFLRGAP